MKDLYLMTIIRGQMLARDGVALAKRLSTDSQGTALLEYSVLAGLLAAASIVAVTAIGSWVSGKFVNLNTMLQATNP